MVPKWIKALGKQAGFKEALCDTLLCLPDLLVVVTDVSFALSWANGYFYSYFECQPQDVAGRPMHEFLGEDLGGDMSHEHVKNLLRLGQCHGHQARTLGPCGSEVFIHWNQQVFADSRGKKWILSVGFPLASKVALSSARTGEEPAPPAEIAPEASVFALAAPEPVPTVVLDEAELSQALAQSGFSLYYQPRVSARTKAITGAEALLRMTHPAHGLLAPEAFLSVAEKSDKILTLGNLVVEEACQKLRQWTDSGYGLDLSLSVNISPQQLLDENFVKTLLAAITQHGVEPAQLILELSERTVAAHYPEARRIIQILRDSGFRVAIDEFSAGALTLSALARLPVNNLKIDRAFLAQAAEEPSAFVVIESIIKLAHGLGCTVTAEGVETRQQLDFLLDNAVDFLQGYLISRPLPADEFERFIQTNPDFYTRHI